MTMKQLTAADPESRSPDLVAENIERLKALFPELVTEGPAGAAVNVDVLKALVGDATVTDADEKYGLNWHGKRRARQLALTPSAGTLRPCPDESVDWDTTQNLMIEGDNLEVLKLLQKSYAGKVKLIYIDPPYNTGKDFVYPDNFQDNIKNYLELTGQVEGGRKISSNTEASGRFHTDWLNMMYPRLKLAFQMLSADGVLMISIDDQEINNLVSLLDEIFGFENRKIITVKMSEPSGLKMGAVKKYGIIPKFKEYVVLVKKGGVSGLPVTPISKEQWDNEYNIFLDGFTKQNKDQIDEIAASEEISERVIGEIDAILGAVNLRSVADVTRELGLQGKEKEEWLFKNSWRICQCATSSTVLRLAEEKKSRGHLNQVFSVVNRGGDRLYLVRGGYDPNSSKPRVQLIFAEDNLTVHPGDFWSDIKTTGLEAEGGVAFKNGKKPIKLLQRILEMGIPHGGLAVDFFAGSGSLAEAIWRTEEISSNTRFILVQLPEPLSGDDAEQRQSYQFCVDNNLIPNVASITKERLRRAAKKIKDENPMFAGDLGFRVFKLDHSNIRAWNPNPADLEASLFDHQDHLLAGRSEADVLYELLLKLGLDLCVPIEQRTIAGREVHSVGGGVLMACLAEQITREQVEPLAQGIIDWHKELAPAGDTTCVFRDSAFQNDVAKTNLAAILEQFGIQNVRSL